MKLLGIDTSTLTASAAVIEARGAKVQVLAARDSGVDTHSENLLPLIDQVLGEAGCTVADLDAIAVGVGPGSFTGLRIGMATAKGLAFAAGKPLWAVSSLAAVALDGALEGKPGDRPIAAVMDARRKEIFVGFFCARGGALEPIGDERVLPPEELPSLMRERLGDEPAVVVGDGPLVYPEALAGVGARLSGARTSPSGASVARHAVAGDRVDVLTRGTPVYIRPSEAEVKFPDGNPGGTFRPPRK